MLMVESKQSRGRLAATSSPSPSPSPTVKRTASLKSSEEWRDMERIDLADLKARIVKKVGADKANRYFSHFKSFISSRLTKPELDKLVVITIGKENVVLHNQFVKAILTNAVKAKAPPSPLLPAQHAAKPPLKPYSPSVTSEDAMPHASPSTMSNGDSFLPSPRRGRSTLRDHRASPLGPRDDHSTPDLSRPVQQLDGAAKQLDAESINSLEHPLKRARVTPPISDESAAIVESGCNQSISRQDENGRICLPLPFGSSTKALLGAPFCFEITDVGWRRPVLHAFPAEQLLQDGPDKEREDIGDLPDNDLMHRLMEQTAAAEGLEGVSKESAVILNHALDAYLNRLIKSCMDVSGSRACAAGADVERPADGAVPRDKMKEALLNMRLHRGINGMHMGPMAELLKKGKEKMQPPLTLTDFKAAMDSSPQQLGEHWPVQLEKISFRIFDQ